MNNIYKIALLVFAITFGQFSYGQTNVPAIITSNQTWNAAGSPYIVNGNTLVEAGVTINIMPGTSIKTTVDRLRLIIDGTVVAKGKKDSVITCDNLTFEFTTNSVGYDPVTGGGSQFSYCLFNGKGAGGEKSIDLKNKSMLVKNCKFIDGYYNIYSYVSGTKDTTALIIENSVFRGVTNKFGYMVYASGTVATSITDCYAENMSGLYLGKWASIRRSSFNNFRSSSVIRQSGGLALNLECNLFRNFAYNAVDLSYPSTNAIINITENTFDSCETFIKMRAGSSFTPSKFVVKNNNFLHYTKNSIKVSGSGTVGKADTFDFQKNYWGTTTTANIDASIYDFTDDITVGGFIDYANYLTSKRTNCSTGGTIGGADTSGINSGGNSSVYDVKAGSVNMFPNPANNLVVVYGDALIRNVKVTDLQGKVILNLDANDLKVNVNLDTLIDGVYLLETSGDGYINRSKLMVKH